MLSAVRYDLRQGSGQQRLALVAVLAWMAYEWGPGNEIVTPWLLANAIRGFGAPLESDGDQIGFSANADRPLAIIIWTALAGFVFTTVQQIISGITALIAFATFSTTASAAATMLSSSGSRQPRDWHCTNIVGRLGLSVGLGTTAVALGQGITTGSVGVRRHLSAVLQSAVLAGVVVGALGTAAAAASLAVARSPAVAPVVEPVLAVAANPLPWLLLAVASLVLARQAGKQQVLPIQDPAPLGVDQVAPVFAT